MALSSALEWWDEWQLRVLVLASLGLQYILAIFAGGRRLPVSPWYRFLVWLSYLGSDALAIYALATLFNRQKDRQCNSTHGRQDLEVLWAPILLMHLGGQIFITAYNIEDNELWRRHIVTTISQVTVAIYVFCKSWSSSADNRLLAAAILLFFIGAAKCLDKSSSLRSSSFNSLSRLPAQKTLTKHADQKFNIYSYVEQAKSIVEKNYSPKCEKTEKKNVKKELHLPHKLFMDFGNSYSDRLTTLKFFIPRHDHKAYQDLRKGLSNIFQTLYTKWGVFEKDVPSKTSLKYSASVWTITFVLSIVPISLFHTSDKQTYSSSDVIVSLVLLYGTFVLDITSLFIFAAVAGIAERYPDVVPQNSLIGFCADNTKSMKPSDSSKKITSLVHQHVRDGWEKFITDAEHYWKFSDIRGQWKLQSKGRVEQLGWSLEKPFDESILIWHIATDFCFHRFHNMDTSIRECADRSIEISNYMMHLLYANPEMLMAGSRSNLFKTACDEIKEFLKKTKKEVKFKVKVQLKVKGILDYDTSMYRKELTKQIINEVKSHHLEIEKETFLRDAWKLYEALTHITEDTQRWDVIQGVWIEKLCFSASRCRGYLHAKSLGSGVEYLSYVWLLLAHAGMETFSERLQRTCKFQLSKEKTKHPQDQVEDAFASPDTGGSELPRNKEQIIDSLNEGTELCRDEETTAAPSAFQAEGNSHNLNEIVVSP